MSYKNLLYIKLKPDSRPIRWTLQMEATFYGSRATGIYVSRKFGLSHLIRFLARTLQLDHFCSQSWESFSKTQWKFMKMTNICPKHIFFYAKSTMVPNFSSPAAGFITWFMNLQIHSFKKFGLTSQKLLAAGKKLWCIFTWYSF